MKQILAEHAYIWSATGIEPATRRHTFDVNSVKEPAFCQEYVGEAHMRVHNNTIFNCQQHNSRRADM